jgi:hypothetical protein
VRQTQAPKNTRNRIPEKVHDGKVNSLSEIESLRRRKILSRVELRKIKKTCQRVLGIS